MTFWDWLASGNGQELVHAVILLVQVVTVLIMRSTRAKTEQTEKRLDRYVHSLMEQIHGGHEHR